MTDQQGQRGTRVERTALSWNRVAFGLFGLLSLTGRIAVIVAR